MTNNNEEPDVFERAATSLADALTEMKISTRDQLIETLAEEIRKVFETLTMKIPPKRPESLKEIDQRWRENKVENMTFRQAAMDVGFCVNEVAKLQRETVALTSQKSDLLLANRSLRDQVDNLKTRVVELEHDKTQLSAAIVMREDVKQQ